MKNVVKLFSAIAIIATMFSTTACNLQEQIANEFGDSENELLALSMVQSEDVDAATLKTGEHCNDCSIPDRLPDCASYSESSETFPKSITIDFRDGCEDKHGRVKAGKIIIEITNDLSVSGAECTATFTDFSINGNPVTGVRKTVNLGLNENGNIVFSHSSSMTIEGFRGTMTRSMSGQKEWIAGYDTDTHEDDIFSLTGSGTMSSEKGSHSRTIIEPLIIDKSCGYLVSGIVEVDGKKGLSSIDFGDGSCDNVAVISKDGESKTINLDELHRPGRRPI